MSFSEGGIAKEIYNAVYGQNVLAERFSFDNFSKTSKITPPIDRLLMCLPKWKLIMNTYKDAEPFFGTVHSTLSTSLFPSLTLAAYTNQAETLISREILSNGGTIYDSVTKNSSYEDLVKAMVVYSYKYSIVLSLIKIALSLKVDLREIQGKIESWIPQSKKNDMDFICFSVIGMQYLGAEMYSYVTRKEMLYIVGSKTHGKPATSLYIMCADSKQSLKSSSFLAEFKDSQTGETFPSLSPRQIFFYSCLIRVFTPELSTIASMTVVYFHEQLGNEEYRTKRVYNELREYSIKNIQNTVASVQDIATKLRLFSMLMDLPTYFKSYSYDQFIEASYASFKDFKKLRGIRDTIVDNPDLFPPAPSEVHYYDRHYTVDDIWSRYLEKYPIFRLVFPADTLPRNVQSDCSYAMQWFLNQPETFKSFYAFNTLKELPRLCSTSNDLEIVQKTREELCRQFAGRLSKNIGTVSNKEELKALVRPSHEKSDLRQWADVCFNGNVETVFDIMNSMPIKTKAASNEKASRNEIREASNMTRQDKTLRDDMSMKGSMLIRGGGGGGNGSVVSDNQTNTLNKTILGVVLFLALFHLIFLFRK